MTLIERALVFYAIEATLHEQNLYTDERWAQLMEFLNAGASLRPLVEEFSHLDYNPIEERIETVLLVVDRSFSKEVTDGWRQAIGLR